MARPMRINYPGAFYHVTSRGNERKDVYKSKRDREKFFEYLDSATQRYDAVIHVFCLMDNHYHLLLETPSGNLKGDVGSKTIFKVALPSALQGLIRLNH